MTTSANRLFQHHQGLKYHGLALAYVVTAYTLGWVGLFDNRWPVNIFCILLLAHGMTIAAYLIHECAHNTVFRDNKHNALLGSLLSWVCGACYGTYEDIRYKHFRHHVDNDDVVWFDYEAFFDKHPHLLGLTLTLEWLYIPAHELLMHTIMGFTSFIIPQRRNQRLHNLLALVVRGSVYLSLLWFSPRVALLYLLAYFIFLLILRFMDSIQHDYGSSPNLFEGEVSEHKGDTRWEQEHTFSPMISLRHTWLNALVLNFSYHNAHHARPTTPWFALPELHRDMFDDDPTAVVPLWPQILAFHRYRVQRVMGVAPGFEKAQGKAFLRAAQRAQVTGGNAASFLTSF